MAGPASSSSRGPPAREGPTLAVVIPTLDEEGNIGPLLRRLDVALRHVHAEVVLVDDGSTDGTLDEARAAWPDVRIVQRRERGLGTAVVRGLAEAKADLVAVLDADGQHPPEVLPDMVAEAERGADLVVASRYRSGGDEGEFPLRRRVVSRGARRLARVALPEARRVTDPMSGFFLVRRSAIDPANLQPQGYKVLLEILVRHPGLRVAEVGFEFGARGHGESKLSTGTMVEYLGHLRSLSRVARARGRPRPFRPATAFRARLRAHAGLLAVVLVALFVRAANLFPAALYGDEAEYASVARSLMHDARALQYPDLERFGPAPFVSQPPVLLYMFAAAGRLVGDAGAGAILVSVLLGVATCAVLYALGTMLHGRGAGTMAGLVLAVLPFHVSLSRKALLDAGLGFFIALTVLALVAWTRVPTRRRALFVGAAAALATFSKLYGVLVFAPLVGVWVALALDRTWRAHRHPPWLHAGWMVVPTLVLASLHLFLLHSLRATQDLVEKLGWNYVRVTAPERLDATTTPSQGLPWHWYFTNDDFGLVAQLGFVVAALAVIGVVVLAWKARTTPNPARAAWVAVLLWPLAVVGFFTLSDRKEWFYVLPAAPGLVLVAVLPFSVLAERAWREARSWWVEGRANGGVDMRRVPVLAGILALVLLVALAPAAGATLGRHVLDDKPYGYGLREAARVIDGRDPEAAQIGTTLGRFTLHYENGHPTYHFYVGHDFVDREIEAGRARYLVLDTYLDLGYEQSWLRDLVDRYGAEPVTSFSDSNGEKRVTVYEFPSAPPAGGPP